MSPTGQPPDIARWRSLILGFLLVPILPGFYLALVLYGTATVVWIYVLSRVPLIEAYPWIAGATVTVPLIGWWCYGEQVTPSFWLGMAMIVAGLVLTQTGTLRQ